MFIKPIQIVIAPVALLFLYWILKGGDFLPKLAVASVFIGPTVLIYLLTNKILYSILYLVAITIGFFTMILIALKNFH